MELFCGRPAGTVDVEGSWNHVPPDQAMMAAAAGFSIASVQDRVRNFLIGNNLTVVVFDPKNDFKVLDLDLPLHQIIDIQQHYGAMRSKVNLPTLKRGKKYGLSSLAEHVLGRSIQDGPHYALEDARATMALFKAHRGRILEAHVSNPITPVF